MEGYFLSYHSCFKSTFLPGIINLFFHLGEYSTLQIFNKLADSINIILTRICGDYGRGLDWSMDLLKSYTHDFEEHAL
jgi:hypothetical protein